MKKIIIFALLFCQCTSPQLNEIQPTSVNVENFDEQIIELSGLPFDIVVSHDWNLKTTSFEHQLWKTSQIQMVFAQNSGVLHILDDSEVINSVDNSAITSFCQKDLCLIQVNGEDLYEVQILSNEGFEALKRLR
jgi:hypothetical protein